MQPEEKTKKDWKPGSWVSPSPALFSFFYWTSLTLKVCLQMQSFDYTWVSCMLWNFPLYLRGLWSYTYYHSHILQHTKHPHLESSSFFFLKITISSDISILNTANFIKTMTPENTCSAEQWGVLLAVLFFLPSPEDQDTFLGLCLSPFRLLTATNWLLKVLEAGANARGWGPSSRAETVSSGGRGASELSRCLHKVLHHS